MTSKEALQNIKEVDTGGEITAPKYKGDVVLEREIQVLEPLVERDTPMKPKVRYGGVYKEYNCSVCNSTLDILGVKEVNFCPKCGQRIDWGG